MNNNNGTVVAGGLTPNQQTNNYPNLNYQHHNPNTSLTSFNFSDISKIDEVNQTPGGFMSGDIRATPKVGRPIVNPYSIIDRNEGQPQSAKMQRPTKARTFADRVDESLQTIEGAK